jgi:hypothetical protein
LPTNEDPEHRKLTGPAHVLVQQDDLRLVLEYARPRTGDRVPHPDVVNAMARLEAQAGVDHRKGDDGRA